MRSKVVLLVFALLLSGCARYSLEFLSNYEPGQDYSQYKTYNYYNESGGGELANNKALADRLQKSVDMVMSDEGYSKADNPDFWVRPYIDVTGTGRNLDPTKYYHGADKEVVGNEQFSSGALVLDFIDADSNQRYWRGVAIGDIAERTPDDRLEKAVEKILENYPPSD